MNVSNALPVTHRPNRLRPTPWGWQYRMMGIRPSRRGYGVVDLRWDMSIMPGAAEYFDDLFEACEHIDRVTEQILEGLFGDRR